MDNRLGQATSPGQAAQMLREVIDGHPYAVVAARWGISRSSVERRVKSLAARLTVAVGVDGLQESGAAFVKRLRLHREPLIRALEHFEPTPAGARRQARVLSAAEVETGARRLRARSARPHHDLALYHLPFACGLRPLEVARLEVADFLNEDGGIRRESVVRPQVAINGRARPLYFAHRALEEALDAHLDDRCRAGHGVGTDGRWRGLDPRSRLFLDAVGRPYAITPNGGVGQCRQVCRPLLDIYRRIFRHAGVPGLCTQSARLTLMSRMYERGADEDQVGLVLGIADRSAVREQLPRPRHELAKVLGELG